MQISEQDVPKVLYHGTTSARANAILKNGFRHARSESYTGTGINLSECITVSYEYGEYENRGAVLAVELNPKAIYIDRGMQCGGLDAWFGSHPEAAGVRLFGGNVWVLWDISAVLSIRKLTHKEALQALYQSFLNDGADAGYNGVASDYHSVLYQSGDRNIDRFPGYRETCIKRLQRAVGPSFRLFGAQTEAA